MIVGIDIGTSYSCAGRVNGEGKVEPVELSTAISMYGSKYSLPSAVFVDDGGNVQVGQAAINSRGIKPQNFIMEFKRLLGQKTPVYLGEKEFMPEDLYTELFRHIKKQTERIGGEPIEKAYVTYPASFQETKKKKIVSAAKRAGLFNVELVDEPTSAAMCYCATGDLQDGQTVLIYDFGGGTFDVSLVKYENNSFTLPTHPLGLERCGGIDVDRAIYNNMTAAVNNAAPEFLEKISGLPRKRFESQLAEKAVKAKHHLTQYGEFSDVISTGPFDDGIPYTLSREKLESMIAGIVGNTITVCRDILSRAGLKVHELAGILMVGGTSRIPLVRRMTELFAGDVPVIYSIDPELAVAQGAVLYEEYKKEHNAGEIHNKDTEHIDNEEKINAAAELLKRTAEQGNAGAQCELGYWYNTGTEVSEDKTEAVRWYRKAAEQGHAIAQFNLGFCCFNGYGVKEDKGEAVRWYKASAEQGNADAQCNLGICYANGMGAPEDKTEAVRWYRKAAEQGHAMAQYNLGVCYEDGIGVHTDKTEAVRWYQAAAEQGNATAQNYLGICYEYGIGIHEDKREALKWYGKAAQQGDEDARKNLLRLR
ncbi:MAG: SEL1-like repeat protein [Oscillospiraceae bacterium]|nr:SEL1-like repeat protein [Oscillospiraceae bacterium]